MSKTTAIFGLILFIGLSYETHAQLRLSVESGLVFPGYNDVRVPNGGSERGTLFSLSEDFEPISPGSFIRFEASYFWNSKHTLEAVAAPLILNFKDVHSLPILFATKEFTSVETTGIYEFNTYRLSYRYRLVDKEKIRFDIGATLLVRDARIALESDNQSASDTDLGFVPLVSFRSEFWPANKLSLLIKGDALVGPQGRAEDIFAGVVYRATDNINLKIGYRIIEGGADVDQVYNFALIHFANVGLQFSI